MRTLFALFFITTSVFSQEIEVGKYFQNSGEIYFSFQAKTKKQFQQASSFVSIDHGSTFSDAHAYANKTEFSSFLTLGIPFQIEQHPGTLFRGLNMKTVSDVRTDAWDYYPSYDLYVEMMYEFEAQYPDICAVYSIGTSEDGRDLLVAKITDNIHEDEGEPRLLYTSSMHGDEISGFVLSLRLIDYLLTQYDEDTRVTDIVNNVALWINPLANPDGAYRDDNSTVMGASRYNANWVDLNRNYPDPEDGLHPDGNSYQSETIAFMEFADSCKFDISSNFHSGAEVANYPWDTWSNTPADFLWWNHVMHEYADTAQAYSNPGYFNAFDDGVTNGFDWYEVDGGRQDYMNYEHRCREFTLEISDDKTPPASQLPYYWEANYRSFLGYIEQSRYGLHGSVTDSLTGEPLYAKVFIDGHDVDSSHVYSHLPNGDYHRYLKSGSYTITISAEGYVTKVIDGVSVLDNQESMLDVQLLANSVSLSDNIALDITIHPNPATHFLNIDSDIENISEISIHDTTGKLVYKESQLTTKSLRVDVKGLDSGVYSLTIKSENNSVKKMVVIH